MARDFHLQARPKTLASQQRDPGAPSSYILEKAWGYCSPWFSLAPLRLLHAPMGSAWQQHEAHAEHARLPPVLPACNSAIHRKQVQLSLLQSSPNTGNSRKQLRRGALRKKEG